MVLQGGGPGGAYTARDVAMLKARRDELSNQLSSAAGRRREIQKSLVGATGADKTGLEQRLSVLDARIARIEGDIEENGRALASPSAMMTSAGTPFAWGPGNGNSINANATPLLMMLMVFVLFPIAIGIGRTLWKRASRPQPSIPSETAHRLERMEQAMDAIAIEVERVSEGQRFMTRLLSESRGEAALIPAQSRYSTRRRVGRGAASAERQRSDELVVGALAPSREESDAGAAFRPRSRTPATPWPALRPSVREAAAAYAARAFVRAAPRRSRALAALRGRGDHLPRLPAHAVRVGELAMGHLFSPVDPSSIGPP